MGIKKYFEEGKIKEYLGLGEYFYKWIFIVFLCCLLYYRLFGIFNILRNSFR